jgi:hypothetical protein
MTARAPKRSKGAGADLANRAPGHSTAGEVLLWGAAMCSQRTERVLTMTADCNDRLSTAFRPSSLAAGAYRCEKRHLGPIVAVNNRQNESKSLQNKEIGQNKKKVAGRIRVGDAHNRAFRPRFPGKAAGQNGWRRTKKVGRMKLKSAPTGRVHLARRGVRTSRATMAEC